jgi:aspartate-semialdehyde dehydrogenase
MFFRKRLYQRRNEDVGETKKIFDDYAMKISATAVRVPVFTSHSESIFVETEKKIDLDVLKKSFQNASGNQA